MSQVSSVSLANLIDLSRALRHSLKAGLSLVEVFRQQSRKGSGANRQLAQSITAQLENGEALEDALKKHENVLPPLFISLVSVGEQSGNMPEIFHELEKYFQLQQKMRRQFYGQIAWPAIQLVAAIFVIAAIPFVLGFFGSTYDPLGLGLMGTTGAITILVVCFGTLAAVIGTIWLLPRVLRGRAAVDRFWLSLPVLGACLQAFALNRLCVALRLTLESGMSTVKATRLTLEATGNEAFKLTAPAVVSRIKKGKDLTSALAATQLLPDEFRGILANAEEAGTLTEVLRHQADHYEEEGRRKLTVLTMAASALVWLLVAGMIIFVIFRLFTSYLSELDKLSNF